MHLKTEEVRVRPPVKQGKLGLGPFKTKEVRVRTPLKLRVRTPFKTREVRVRCRFKMEVLGLGALL